MESFNECTEAARNQLLMAKELLNQEIANYPSPYTGCDEQYNHLLSQRRRISRALQELSAEYRISSSRLP